MCPGNVLFMTWTEKYLYLRFESRRLVEAHVTLQNGSETVRSLSVGGNKLHKRHAPCVRLELGTDSSNFYRSQVIAVRGADTVFSNLYY